MPCNFSTTEICSELQSLLYISKTFSQISIGIRGSRSCFRRFFAIPSAASLRYSLHFNLKQFCSSSRLIVLIAYLSTSAIALLLFPACTNHSIMFLSSKECCPFFIITFYLESHLSFFNSFRVAFLS